MAAWLCRPSAHTSAGGQRPYSHKSVKHHLNPPECLGLSISTFTETSGALHCAGAVLCGLLFAMVHALWHTVQACVPGRTTIIYCVVITAAQRPLPDCTPRSRFGLKSRIEACCQHVDQLV